MPRKLRKMEDPMDNMSQSRMESVPGGKRPSSERSPSPDMAQMVEDMEQARGRAAKEETSKVESLRGEIVASPNLETLRGEISDLQKQATSLQNKFEADGISPGLYTKDNMEFMSAIRGMTRKNATTWEKFTGRLGFMLTGNEADKEFFDDMTSRHAKLQDLEDAIARRQGQVLEITKPKRRTSRVRGGSAVTIEHGMRGGVAMNEGAGDLHIMRDIKESLAARGETAKAKKAMKEVAEEIGPAEMEVEEKPKRGANKRVRAAMKEAASETPDIMLQEEQESMIAKRASERATAQEMREAGKLGKRGQTVEEMEESFGLNEQVPPQPEMQYRENLSREEQQAIGRLTDMSKGLEALRLNIQDLAGSDERALEEQSDLQERLKLFETGIESVIEANLDSTSDELYEAVVTAQGGLKDAKQTYNTVYTLLSEDIQQAGKGKRAMGVRKTGGRSAGGATFGTSAGGRSARVQNFEGPEVISAEQWKRQLEKAQEDYRRHQAEIKAQESRHAESQGVDVQRVKELTDAFSQQARTAEMMAEVGKMEMERQAKETKKREVRKAKKSGMEVRQVETITDPFAERQAFYDSHAAEMKVAMENKAINAAELWEKTNAEIEKLDAYDRADISAALGNAPDLAAAYVLEVNRVLHGDEPRRKNVIRANLVLGRTPDANLNSIIVDQGMQADVKKAGQKIQLGRQKAA